MVVRFIEGFEIGDTNIYEASTGNFTTDFPGRKLGLAENIPNGTFKTRQLTSAQTTWIFGFGMYAESSIASTSRVYCSLALGGSSQFTLELRRESSRFSLYAWRGGNLSVLISSYNSDGSQTFMSTDQWYFFEVKVVLSNTGGAGSVEVRLNGSASALWSLSSIDTASASGGADRFIWHTENDWHFDDIRVFDGSGSSLNDFEGPLEVVGFEPDGNGTVNAWSNEGGAASKVAAVTDDDSDTYLESSVNNQGQMFTFSDISGLVGTVYAVQLNAKMAVGSLGARDARFIARKGSTNYDWGSAFDVAVTRSKGFFEIFDAQPDAAAWSLSDLQALQMGVEVAN